MVFISYCTCFSRSDFDLTIKERFCEHSKFTLSTSGEKWRATQMIRNAHVDVNITCVVLPTYAATSFSVVLSS